MAVYVIEPTIPLPISAEVCNLFAAHSPIVYGLQRRDFEVSGVSDNGGTFRINTTLPYDVLLAVGDRVYLDGIGVASVTALVDADTFDIDATYDAGIIPSFVNLLDTYPDYYMSVRITKRDPGTGVYNQVSDFRVEPDYTGLAKVDISSVTRVTVKATATEGSYGGLYSQDIDNQHAILKVGVAEYTTIQSPYIVVSVPQVLHAAMPVRSRLYGGVPPTWLNTGANMAKYFPVPGGEDKALFLSSVRKLRMWYGLPFGLGWFINNDMVAPGSNIKVVESVKDTNGDDVYPFDLEYTGGPLGDPFGISFNRIMYHHPFATVAGYPSYDPASRVSYVSVTNEDGSITFTEVLPIRHTSCLPKAPVYLRALDYTSTWRYFCFGSRAAYGRTTRNGEAFDRWVDNIAFKTDTGRLLSKSTTPTIKIGAELLDEWDRQICEVILSSVEVQMLTNPLTWNVLDGTLSSYEFPDWVTVKVKDGSFETKTTPTLSAVEMTIELPEVNTQTQ